MQKPVGNAEWMRRANIGDEQIFMSPGDTREQALARQRSLTNTAYQIEGMKITTKIVQVIDGDIMSLGVRVRVTSKIMEEENA